MAAFATSTEHPLRKRTKLNTTTQNLYKQLRSNAHDILLCDGAPCKTRELQCSDTSGAGTAGFKLSHFLHRFDKKIRALQTIDTRGLAPRVWSHYAKLTKNIVRSHYQTIPTRTQPFRTYTNTYYRLLMIYCYVTQRRVKRESSKPVIPGRLISLVWNFRDFYGARSRYENAHKSNTITHNVYKHLLSNTPDILLCDGATCKTRKLQSSDTLGGLVALVSSSRIFYSGLTRK